MSKLSPIFPLIALIVIHLAQPFHHHQSPPQPAEQQQQQQLHHLHQQQLQRPAQPLSRLPPPPPPPHPRSKRQTFDFSMNTPPPPPSPPLSPPQSNGSNESSTVTAGPDGSLGSSLDQPPAADGDTTSFDVGDLLGVGGGGGGDGTDDNDPTTSTNDENDLLPGTTRTNTSTNANTSTNTNTSSDGGISDDGSGVRVDLFGGGGEDNGGLCLECLFGSPGLTTKPGTRGGGDGGPRVKDCMADGSFVCLHGYCSFSDDGSFDCLCDPGWVGWFCDEGCAKNCSNNGTCTVLEGGGDDGDQSSRETCMCPYPWVGPTCADLPPEEEPDNTWLHWLGGSLGAGLLLLPVVAALFMYYLWKKRMVFAMKFVFYFKPYEDNDGLRYDAFVSYVDSPQDLQFAHNVLLPNLEHGMGFRLCLQHRDFDVGGAMSDNIIQTLEDSRRFILVLTPRYLKCEWAQFEYLRAFHEMLKLKIRIVPIIMEDFASGQADNPTLRALLESTTPIKYPGSQASQRQIDKFWKRVRLSMPKRKKLEEAETSSLSTETWHGADPAANISGKAPRGDVENGLDNGGFSASPRPPTETSDVVVVVPETQPSSSPGEADRCTRPLYKTGNIFTRLLKPKREKQPGPVTVRGFRPLGGKSVTTGSKQPGSVRSAERVDGVEAARNQEKLSKAAEELEAKLEPFGALPSA